MAERRLKFWGWGHEDQTLSENEARRVAERIGGLTGISPEGYTAPPALDEISLAAPRLKAPPALSPICSTGAYDRAAHTYGKSYPDYIRAYGRDYSGAPDIVAFPESEGDIIALLDWADGAGAAVIPFGCGSSVVGGIEAAVGDAFKAVLTIDMRRMAKVLEIDPVARAARIQAGALGPDLEAQLKPSGLTLRHFPQSFQFSTLGGWIATRSGGHFATLHTHIDELVESLRSVTPEGVMESRRLPGSGAGPSPDRLMIGSEGALGIITEAWMRLQDKPAHRASAAVRFASFEGAGEAIRAVAQAGLWPSNCRLVDAEETKLAGAGDGSFHMAVLGFESADHPLDAWMARALECARDHGGEYDPPGEAVGDSVGGRDTIADAWRDAFIDAPFKREGLISCGILHDTFETAITWERLADFHSNVKAATEAAILSATGAPGHVSCRFTHAYTDGCAPYFTLHAKAAPGRELEQWREIKTAASDALIREGGTITHHHAVGRDHMPWYGTQRPALFGEALAAVKSRLDPKGMLNPGVIVPHQS
jgi:alkyldihydroxyacetonephosphate synthase